MADFGKRLSLASDVGRAIEPLEKHQTTGEVSVTKFAASQKELQSVSRSVHGVNETVDISGSQDYQAPASAKATVAAFDASKDHKHPRVVELTKMGERLGVILLGGRKLGSPIFISRILPSGMADKHGGLKPGDQILSINGVCVEDESHRKAVELLKHAQGTVKLVVRYTPNILEEMKMKFDKQCPAQRQ